MFQIKSPLQVEMYGRMTWNLLFHGVGGIKLELHFSETMGAKPQQHSIALYIRVWYEKNYLRVIWHQLLWKNKLKIISAIKVRQNSQSDIPILPKNKKKIKQAVLFFPIASYNVSESFFGSDSTCTATDANLLSVWSSLLLHVIVWRYQKH